MQNPSNLVIGPELLKVAAELGGSGHPVRWEQLTWPEAREAASKLNAVIIPVAPSNSTAPIYRSPSIP